MSDMNYEKAWEDLKGHLLYLALFSHNFSESGKYNVDDCLKAQGGEIAIRGIIDFMNEAEKEMSTNTNEIENIE